MWERKGFLNDPTTDNIAPSYQAHKYANLLPLLEGAARDALDDDVRANGLRHSIVLYQGRILDGRNRYAACLRVCIAPTFVEYDGDDPLGFVISANLVRRELNDGQRAALAVEFLPHLERQAKERQRRGSKKLSDPSERGKASEHAARLFRTNALYVEQAKKIRATAPDVAKALRDGVLNIPDAIRLCKEDKKKRSRFLRNRRTDPTLTVKRAFSSAAHASRPRTNRISWTPSTIWRALVREVASVPPSSFVARAESGSIQPGDIDAAIDWLYELRNEFEQREA